jgi:hypothetical protein
MPLMTARQLAAELGLQKRTINAWRYESQAGKIVPPFPEPAGAIGASEDAPGWFLWELDDVIAWRKSRPGRWPKTDA